MIKTTYQSIAVLPFVNRSSQEEAEYFSDGLSEEIINALAKIKGLKVTSRSSAFSFKNHQLPLTEISQQLKVSIIVEGSVRLAGNQARISAQLIDVKEDFLFWSETFDRPLDNIFQVQDEISLLIADQLREYLGHFELEDHLVTDYQVSSEVHKAYLQGHYELMKLDVSSTQKGIKILDEVINEAPHFPLPYLDINQAYTYLGTMGLIPAVEAFIKAKPYLDKAIEIAQDLPETQINLAWISCWQYWDLKKSYQHLHRALEIKPSDLIYLSFSNLLAIEGRFKAAHTYIDKAIQLDPFSAMDHHFKGFIYYLQQDYTNAIPLFQKSISINPHLPFPHLALGLSYLLNGQVEQGWEHFSNLKENQFGDLTKLGGLTLSYIFKKDQKKTEEHLGLLHQKLEAETRGSALFFLVLANAQLKQKKKALSYLEQGMEQRFPNMLLIFTEPLAQTLAEDPLFLSLRKKAFKPEEITSTRPRKYKKALLNPELLSVYKEKLEQLMLEERPYLDPDLSLRSLANKLEIPPNHLSQLLNEGFAKNFSEYVNTYRVETFKQLLPDPAYQHLTILALAFESGFNSKTVFNTFFKKITGKTPGSYWKDLRI